MWWIAVAVAGPLEPGERLEWSVEWMGMTAGTAWATLKQSGESWIIEAGCDSAGMVDRMYSIHDTLVSHWSPADGSRRYVTRFREGRFHQDQEMELAPDSFLVRRSQRFTEGWRTWEDRYTGQPDVEDPVSAFYRLRTMALSVGDVARFPLFTGKRTVTLQASVVERVFLGTTATLKVEVATEHKGDLEGRFTVYMTEDADRVPLKVAVPTRAGPVNATLAKRSIGG